MPAFAKVRVGETIAVRASEWNAMLDAARAHHRSEDLPRRQAAQRFWQSSIIRVKNNTGSDVSRGAALGIGDPLITPDEDEDEFFSRLYFLGETPAAEHFGGKFCIVKEALDDGEIGLASVAGIVQAVLKINDADHQWADIKSGELQSDWFGTARILYKETGTGSGKKAMLQLAAADIQALYGKLDGSLSPDGSATVSVYYLSGGTWTDTDDNLTAYAPPLLTSGSVSSDAWVRIEWDSQAERWHVTAYECV